MTGSALTLIPSENYNGSELISVSVSDGTLQDSSTFTLLINAVNDAPFLGYIEENISFNEDSSLLIPLSVIDADGDSLYFDILGGEQITGVVNSELIEDEYSFGKTTIKL